MFLPFQMILAAQGSVRVHVNFRKDICSEKKVLAILIVIALTVEVVLFVLSIGLLLPWLLLSLSIRFFAMLL